MRAPASLLIAWLLPAAAGAQDNREARSKAFSPGRRLSLGAGGGLAVGPRENTGHWLVEATVTGLFSRNGAQLAESLTRVPNLSVGLSSGSGARYLYGEISGYLILSVGLGVGHRFAPMDSQVRRGTAYHFFVGLPLGTPMADPDLGLFGFAGMPYLEPYYRSQVGWSEGHGTIHEIGILARMSFGKPWSVSF
jgi:hypothetical protein